MSLREAELVASIVETAEGGCGGCLNEAVKELNEKFPMYVWTMVAMDCFMPSIIVKAQTIAAPIPVPEYRPRRC